MRLYLIGMPGCGKSTIGKLLSDRIGYQFIDMDNYIEQKACMFIDEIFDLYGEDYFRALEANVLDEFNSMDDVIIATGGGMIKNNNNKSKMNGKCIYINTSIENIKKHLATSSIERPLLKKYTVEDLYNERKYLYEYFSDIVVENEEIEATIKDIRKELGL